MANSVCDRLLGIELLATYRVGNGAAGNIGAKTLAHIVTIEGVADNGVTNLLPARGGINPETIEEVRQRAPSAFPQGTCRYIAGLSGDCNPTGTLPKPATSTCNEPPPQTLDR